MTGEQRFTKCLNQLFEERKHEFREARRHGELTQDMRSWQVNDEAIVDQAHLTRSFTEHRKQGSQVTLTEYEHIMQLVFSFCETDEERFEEMLNANTLLFCHTTETAANDFEPFGKPLVEMWKDMKKSIAESSFERGKELGIMIGSSAAIR